MRALLRAGIGAGGLVGSYGLVVWWYADVNRPEFRSAAAVQGSAVAVVGVAAIVACAWGLARLNAGRPGAGRPGP